MVVRLRMRRTGRRNCASFRLGAFDGRCRRDGRCLEILGFYDPKAKTPEKQLVVKAERVKHWLSVGAQPSVKVAALLRKQGVIGRGAAKAAAGQGQS